MSLLKSLWSWFRFPQYLQGECPCCLREGWVIDLDDGDVICKGCWDQWPTGAPDYVVEAYKARRRRENRA